jgi:4'-phosphopantetheinyl transferase
MTWSAKESALKALRVGLTVDTRTVEVIGVDAGWPAVGWRPVVARCSGRTLTGWWREERELMRTIVADPPAALPIPIASSARPNLVRSAQGR